MSITLTIPFWASSGTQPKPEGAQSQIEEIIRATMDANVRAKAARHRMSTRTLAEWHCYFRMRVSTISIPMPPDSQYVHRGEPVMQIALT